ncbi:MAG: FeoA family protein [Firmicutes bacterium]|nr:FeoA family protein [Bacillota bacterium]
MIVPLNQVCMGSWACVISVDTDQQMQKRLFDFGLVPGTKVRLAYASPGGHVAAIELRGSVLALRDADLCRIRVQV